MTLLDLCFNITKTKDYSDEVFNYDFWTIDNEGNYLFCKKESNKEYFWGDLEGDITEFIPHLKDNYFGDTPYFIPYEELEYLTKIEVEVRGQIAYSSCQKYPLVCVRGICHECCEKKADEWFYCFHEIPCLNKRPDCNCYSAKYPDFWDFLSDTVKFVKNCPHTETFIIMLDFIPSSYEKELHFDYTLVAVLIEGTKITFVNDSYEIKRLYEEYNKKYPTEDREIEDVISDPDENFYFKF